MSCAVALEGFYISGRYIAKELTILFEPDNYQHFMFNNPDNLTYSGNDYSTVKYTQRLNGLSPANDCFLPYSIIGLILDKIQNYRIHTAGNQSKDFLSSYLPHSEVIDICQLYNFKYPLHLPPAPCFRQHPSRYCSLAKAIAIKSTADEIHQELLQWLERAQ